MNCDIMKCDQITLPNAFTAVMDITKRPNIVFVSGAGSWLVDNHGKRYLDFIQGWAVNCLGHCHPAVVGSIKSQADKLINPSPAFYNEPMVSLANMIVKLSGLDHVFFTNSGAEANEGAIKLARKWGSKYRNGAFEIITFRRAFHGRTLATMSASGKSQWDGLFEPRVAGFPKAELNDLESVSKLIGPATVAVMLEPIQGEAGVFEADSQFLTDLRLLTKQHNLLLILDEVQTGVGRTGSVFAFEQYGIVPDILTLGKGLGGGTPLAALVATKDASCFEYGDQGGTYNGNPLITAVGCAVLETISDREFLDDLAVRSAYFKEQLLSLVSEFGLKELRGRGMLLALSLGRNTAAEIAAKAFDRGLLLNAPQPDSVRLVPSLLVSMDEIDLAIGILRGILTE